jgi:hypothetical protein
MPHLGRNEILKAKAENNLCPFTGEQARRTLDEVRERYGLRQPESPANPLMNIASRTPKEPARQQLRPTVTEPAILNPPFLAAERMRPGPNLERGGVRQLAIPSSRSPSDDQSFHYLIRVAECTLPLHCEVTANSEPTAKHRVKQIRNLLEWREISVEELAEIIKNEKNHLAASATQLQSAGRTKRLRPCSAEPMVR